MVPVAVDHKIFQFDQEHVTEQDRELQVLDFYNQDCFLCPWQIFQIIIQSSLQAEQSDWIHIIENDS